MVDTPTSIENASTQIRELAAQFAQTVSGMTDDIYFREAALKSAITAIGWELYDAFPQDRDTIHDEFGTMGTVLQEEYHKDLKEKK